MKFFLLLAAFVGVSWSQLFFGGGPDFSGYIVTFNKQAQQQYPIEILEWIAKTSNSYCKASMFAEEFRVAGNLYFVLYNSDSIGGPSTDLQRQIAALGGTVILNYLSTDLSKFQPLWTLATRANATAPPGCTTQSCNCCARPLTNDMYHLSLLDPLTTTTAYCGPRECPDKLDVFLFSTGLDKNNPELSHTTPEVFDCVPAAYTSSWAPNEDLYGRGTHIAGFIASKTFGATLNVRLHSVKIMDDSYRSQLSSLVCAMEKLESWMIANPTKNVILVIDALFDMRDPFLLVSSMTTTYSSRLLIFAYPFYCQYPTKEADVIGIGMVDRTYTFLLADASCVDILEPTVGARCTAPRNYTISINDTSVLPTFGMTVGVFAEYWQERSNNTAVDMRKLTTSATDTDITKAKVITSSFSPVGITKKIIRYTCPTGCTACESPRKCTTCCHGKATCDCPLSMTGVKCNPITCPRGATKIAHPDYCDVSIVCSNGKATRCSREGRQQRFFDMVLSRCVIDSDAMTMRACKPLPRC